VEELTKLPGVGRKTAVAILANGFDKIEGIPCDTHCIRLAYRLGWTKNKNPDKIEQDMMKLFDKKEWKKLPWILKAHGRALCTAPIPKCSKCPLEKICPKVGVTKKE
jgi:endonuclease-3